MFLNPIRQIFYGKKPMTYSKQMTTNSYGRLKTPPKHPDARTQLAEEIKFLIYILELGLMQRLHLQT